jgi:alpha 1,2-mannosyltransferase
VSLRLLRSYNCTLPATIFHFPSESPSQSQLEDFATLNTYVLPLPSLSKNPKPGQTKNFEIKGAAMVEAPYDETLLIDSDNIPVRDPSFLFDSREFKEYGAILWPDYFKDSPENVRFRLSPHPSPDADA